MCEKLEASSLPLGQRDRLNQETGVGMQAPGEWFDASE
jgi:hypothetical protein